MPSSVGYLLAAFVAAVALFFGLWYTLVSGGDEAPWIPAGLAASVVLLVALSAREVVMRRAWTRYLLDQGGEPATRSSGKYKRPTAKSQSTSTHSSAWRSVQRQSKKLIPAPIRKLIWKFFTFVTTTWQQQTRRCDLTLCHRRSETRFAPVRNARALFRSITC